MHRDSELVRRSGEEPADVGVGPEREGPVVEEPGDERLGDEESAAVAGGQGGSLVKEGAGVEDLKDFGVG